MDSFLTGTLSLALAWLVAMTAGCAVEREPVEAPLEMPGSFSSTGGGEVQAKWWRVFGDSSLDALIERASTDNMSLKVAWMRVSQAEALAEREGSVQYPQVEARAGGDVGYRISNGQGEFSTGYSLLLAANYEVDLWGRIANEVQAVEIDVEVSRAEVGAVAVTVSGEISVAWFQLVAARAEQLLLEEQIGVSEQWLELVELRYGYGKAGAADVLRQRQQIESAQADVLRLEIRIEQLETRLAILVGVAPGSISLSDTDALPDPPSLPAAGVPLDALQKRPDVQAAMLRVQAADSRVAAAVADQYPRLSIGARASRTDDIAIPFANWIFGLGADIVAPIFDGGRRSAEVDRREAVVDGLVYSYGETLLSALGEVEEALAALRHQEEVLVSLERQLELARAAESQARVAYANGQGSYLDVLDTVRTLQALERTLLSEELELLLRHVQLHRALGGGWALPRAERPGTSESEPETE